jgi:hypothetical protein
MQSLGPNLDNPIPSQHRSCCINSPLAMAVTSTYAHSWSMAVIVRSLLFVLCLPDLMITGSYVDENLHGHVDESIKKPMAMILSFLVYACTPKIWFLVTFSSYLWRNGRNRAAASSHINACNRHRWYQHLSIGDFQITILCCALAFLQDAAIIAFYAKQAYASMGFIITSRDAVTNRLPPPMQNVAVAQVVTAMLSGVLCLVSRRYLQQMHASASQHRA